MFSGKRALIIGASGLIGSNLTDRLLKENADVVAMGRNEAKLTAVFEPLLDTKRLSFVEGNIKDGLDSSVGKFDYIFHAASPISGKEIQTRPLNTIEANILGIKNCIEYIRATDADDKPTRLIVFSSATVYGTGAECDTRVT